MAKQIKKQFKVGKYHTNKCIYEHAIGVQNGKIEEGKGVFCEWKDCKDLKANQKKAGK